MLLLALVQTFIVALSLGLPLYVALRLLWWNVRGAVARRIDLCFLLKDSFRPEGGRRE